MWCLESPSGEVYNITPGRVHTVSRKNGDIILANDQSVSRKHAYLEVRSPITEGVSVWDDSSKYGTFVNDGIINDRKLPADFRATITEGAKVRFGLQDMNIWTLKREKLCVCAHSLKPTEKSKVKAVLNQMGFALVDDWLTETSHLTTNYLRLSCEVMCALASAKPIVLPEFWQHYAGMMTGKEPCPDPVKFMPPLEDRGSLGSRKGCLPNLARKTIFVNKIFIFSNSQSYNAYKTVVELAGGKALKMSDCGMSLADYCKPNVVVLGCDNDQTSFYNKVLSTLIDKNLRIIPLEEIGLALWKVSTSTYCNPTHSANSILRRSNDNEVDLGTTLVAETEETAVSTGVDIDDYKVIPPTLTENLTEDNTMSMSVRATEKTSPVAATTRKRIRENTVELNAGNNSTFSSSKTPIKKEPEEEEDMFAFEDDYSRPSTSNNISSHFNLTNSSSSSKRFKTGLSNSVAKEDNKSADDDNDGFLFKSPPKKKKIQQRTEEEEESDMFELPKEPTPTKSHANENDDEESDFLSTSKFSKSVKRNKGNLNDQSKDMFETQELPSSACSWNRGEKRKGRGDSESESPPPKKPPTACLDVTNAHNSLKPSISSSGFINKPSKSLIKTEVKNENDDETDLALRLCARVVITPLLRKSQVNGHNSSSSANSTVKNFKKFRKVWTGSATKHHITTSCVRNGHTLDFTVRDEEEDDPDPFIPSRQSAPRTQRNGRRSNVDDDDDGDDDEFALPTFSQCM